jgi:hypothetical protein
MPGESAPAKISVYPNPFNSEVRIQITEVRKDLSGICLLSSDLSIHIYDISGRLVRKLLLPTAYSLLPTVAHWDGTDNKGNLVPSGVYFYRLTSNEVISEGKLIKLK